jgi:hypothetical protein
MTVGIASALASNEVCPHQTLVVSRSDVETHSAGLTAGDKPNCCYLEAKDNLQVLQLQPEVFLVTSATWPQVKKSIHYRI